MKKLKQLKITNAKNIGHEGILNIINLKSLETLILHDNGICNDINIEQLTNLKFINISYFSSLNKIKITNNIKSIDLSFNILLTEINLSNNKLELKNGGSIDYNIINNFILKNNYFISNQTNKLISLILNSSNQIPKHNIVKLLNNSFNLKHLESNEYRHNITSMKLLLTKLSLANIYSLTDKEFKEFNILTDLTDLILKYTNIGDESIQTICQLTNLKYLDLQGTNISYESLLHLTNLTNLEYLNICDIDIDTKSLKYIEDLFIEREREIDIDYVD